MLFVNSIEKKFLNFAQNIPADVTPGFALQVFERGQKRLDVEWGKTWRYYDLASLTKIFFTVPWMMKLAESSMVELHRPLLQYLPWATPQWGRVQDVLAHNAGNDWWQPFYKSLSIKSDVEYRKNQLKELLRSSEPKTRPEQSVYSDIDFFLLGFLLESVCETSWNQLWNVLSEQALQSSEMFFHESHRPRFNKNLYAPTEKDAWRGHLLQGEVHDENAWALGGVAPHAGLFGSVDAVSQWGLWLRQVLLNEDKWLSARTLKKFSQRAMSPSRGDWGLGFMLPTKGSASCGKYFSLSTIGHTGFTGTSFWFDMDKDIFVVLLSNRVHPTRKNEAFKKWRPQIHDCVMQILSEE